MITASICSVPGCPLPRPTCAGSSRERRDLYLRALGYRYNEIAELTDATYTAVISGG